MIIPAFPSWGCKIGKLRFDCHEARSATGNHGSSRREETLIKKSIYNESPHGDCYKASGNDWIFKSDDFV
jgi:hypothetical protein